MYLVIAEKPSVSRAIAEVIGAQEREDGYLQGTDCMVSWCFGHLAEYVSPDAYDEKFNQWRYEDLPIIPKDWKVTVSEDKKDQFYILKRLLNSPEIEYVVNACDAGREGELIFKHVYDLSGSKKPVKRLWISSLEDSAILDGMQHLRSAEEYRHLAEAAVCRSQADWLVGMNATRAYTTKYFKKLTVTPTINLNQLYEAYKAQPGVTMETVCRKIADIVIEAPIQVDLKSILNYEDVKDKGSCL